MNKHVPIILLCYVVNLIEGGVLIKCSCTTSECQNQSKDTCETSSVCYTQFYDRKDGSNPIIKGCVSGETPLLCENRRPALVPRSDWPILSCCKTEMCNKDELVTQGSTIAPEIESNVVKSEHSHKNQNYLSDKGEENKGNKLRGRYEYEIKEGIEKLLKNRNSNRSDSSETKPVDGMSISPIYISVLVSGILSLIVIGTIAIYILKRNNRRFDTEYGTVDYNGYLKGTSIGSSGNISLPNGNESRNNTEIVHESSIRHNGLQNKVYDNEVAIIAT